MLELQKILNPNVRVLEPHHHHDTETRARRFRLLLTLDNRDGYVYFDANAPHTRVPRASSAPRRSRSLFARARGARAMRLRSVAGPDRGARARARSRARRRSRAMRGTRAMDGKTRHARVCALCGGVHAAHRARLARTARTMTTNPARASSMMMNRYLSRFVAQAPRYWW